MDLTLLLRNFVIMQLKTMQLVVWPVERPDYILARPLPLIDNVKLHILPDLEALKEKVACREFYISTIDWINGSFDFKFQHKQTAFVAIHDKIFAGVAWAAVGEEAAENLVFDPPITLNWRTSSIISGAYTPPAFRGKQLYPFILGEMINHLKSEGFKRIYGSYHKSNVPSRKGLEKVNALCAAICFRIRVGMVKNRKYIPLLSLAREKNGKRLYKRKFCDDSPFWAYPISNYRC
jgi:hypothetical protein